MIVASLQTDLLEPIRVPVVVDYLPPFHPRAANLGHELVIVFIDGLHLQLGSVLAHHFRPVDFQVGIFLAPHQHAVLEPVEPVVVVRVLPTEVKAPS